MINNKVMIIISLRNEMYLTLYSNINILNYELRSALSIYIFIYRLVCTNFELQSTHAN